MELVFLTPLGALVGLAALIPLAVYRARERRLRGIRAALRLEEPSRQSRLSFVAALAAVCGLVALAAAQPVLATMREVRERTDAQVFLVVDTSRSMLASEGPGAPTRFDRAREIAQELANQLPEVPVGVASMTDGLLPHLFPTTDRQVLQATLGKTLDIESPGPSTFFSSRATTYDALEAAPTLNYFPPAAEKRVLVVLTDGETRPLERDLATAFRRGPKIETVFVRLWNADERIYLTGVAEFGYSADPKSEAVLGRVASTVGGRVVTEGDSEGLRQAVVDLLGTGPTMDRRHEGDRLALMPWITLAAFLPLGFVLFRRNF
ncbi:MAG: VWA domain-containing protein [Actinomycetota bacterium]|nr:VWA domain-containing protein [Actinomycetota bacterium]